MDLNLIKPKVKNESDKYSWNLYKYLLKHKNTKVYYSKINSFTDDEHTYDKSSLVKMDTLIGVESEDGLIGARLIDILRKIPSMDFWYGNVKNNHVEITEDFFNDYIEIGRCLFDQSHDGLLRNADNRFTYINEDERKCNWCGIEQHKEIEEEIKHVTHWI